VEITKDVEPYFEFCLAMECAALEPYLRFVYDDYEQALAVERFLGENGLLESSPPHGRVLLEDGEPVAMGSGVPGAALRKIRLRSALLLQREKSLRPDDATRRRIQLASSVLMTVEDTDYYCSKVGVSRNARNKGAGADMMNFLTAEGRELGFRRVIGEIQDSNPAMVRLMCEKVGWDRFETRRVEDPESGRSLEYVHIGLVY
jgi:hypothetical protein